MRNRAFKTLFIFAALASPWSHVFAEVTHEVSFPDLKQQYIHVRSEFPAGGLTATLRMANWNPGSYLIRDFAANVDRISFRSENGDPLEFSKSSKNSWQINLAGATRVLAEYDVHAGDLSVNTSWASSDYVLLNASSVFLFSDVSRNDPQRVEVQAPTTLEHVYSSMSQSGNGNVFNAASFDELVDSPIIITDAPVRRFAAQSGNYALVNVGATGLWDENQTLADIQAIVNATNRLWGTVPFERPFWFFNFLVERGGGLEHDHSTVIMGSRWQMLKREDYIKWLSLAAHEYFHAWNIRRMRPASLADYDLDNEQYSSALWLAEGITSYYDNLLLSRAGLVGPDEYFKRLAIDIHALELTPGREMISLEQASRDAWIRHYQPDANSINSTISYYTKGAVLGLVLDAKIREASNNELSLDDVMRAMFTRWGETPYPDDAFANMVAEIAGEAVKNWLVTALGPPSPLGIDEALAYYGLVLERQPVNNAARLAGQPLVSGIGVNWDTELPGLVIKNVIRDMAGAEAGLLPGDELLAINGERVKDDDYDDRMMRLQPGTEVSLTISRRGLLQDMPITLQEARPATYEIRFLPEFDREFLRRLESWLGQALQLDSN
ncbi:MAG: M61 family metallopeptidase [Xanthomonadales bacterium]|nr:M61 family metallopeptidase [Xanthomonadales bacterium]